MARIAQQDFGLNKVRTYSDQVKYVVKRYTRFVDDAVELFELAEFAHRDDAFKFLVQCRMEAN